MDDVVIYTDSLYTSAIMELERAADFVESFGRGFDGIPVSKCCKEMAADISKAIRARVDKLRSNEEQQSHDG